MWFMYIHTCCSSVEDKRKPKPSPYCSSSVQARETLVHFSPPHSQRFLLLQLVVLHPKMMRRRSTDDEKKKQKKKMNCYNGPDRISDLPDALLLYILSFLDIRYVISTSLLSRRWRFLWSGLGILNISDEVYNDCRSPNGYVDQNALKIDFTDYVHRMLLMRDQSSDISLFRFSYTDTDSEYIDWEKEDKKFLGDIYLCILVLIRSKVQVLDLRISSMPARINLPHCLFSCKSLTTLKLDMEPNDIDVGPVQPLCILPTTEFGMNLPALRVLLLRSLSIVGDVGKLISSCPVLQVFVLSKCKVKLCGRQLNISGSQLKMLEIEEVEDFRSETDSLEYCKVNVLAPKLTSFMSRSTTTMNDYSFVDTSSLVNAEIETDEHSWGYYFYDDGKESDQRMTWKQEFGIHLIKCFSGIRNVRSLTLAAWLLTTIPKAQADFRSLRVDPFCNLRILKLQTSLWKDEILGITCLLKKCPTLETLVLEMIEYEGGFAVEEDDVWKAELEPQCLMNHLKLIEIWDILTCVLELEFMKFLLKNATTLEKMIVHTPKKQSPSDKIKLKSFGEKLKTFPAASSMTRILFLSDAKPREHDADPL